VLTDPVRDIETITTELVLADLEGVQKRHDKIAKDAKRGNKEAIAEVELLKKLESHLNEGKPAITLNLTPEDKAAANRFFLLSDKPTILAANVAEADLATADSTRT
jgi:ribosome-binding ATPase YchF (GTP1/OBG family)